MGFLPKGYTNPEDFIKDLADNIPPILYKYRDWNNAIHATSLREATVWFSNPKTLNDPFDVVVPYYIDYGEVYQPSFYDHMVAVLEEHHPDLAKNRMLLKERADQLVNKIRSDPEKWFESTTKGIQDSSIWGVFGVLSLTHNPLNEVMWAHYANNGRGFCIGYNPMDIYFRGTLRAGKVIYTENIKKYSLLADEEQYSHMDQFTKHKKWEYEEEYRFVSDIEEENERLFKLSKSAIKEVILGKDISIEHEAEIKDCLRGIYNSNVKLYKVMPKKYSYGFEAISIIY